MYDAISGFVISRMPDAIMVGPRENECGFTHRVLVMDPSKFTIGQYISLITFLQKTEYVDTLYGFDNHGQIILFNDLRSADGIGPKAALAILSLAPVEDIKQAIRLGNAGYLRQAKGVNKGADSIILKLGKRYSNENFEKENTNLI